LMGKHGSAESAPGPVLRYRPARSTGRFTQTRPTHA
jgi:hypothetical protein